MIAYDIAGRGGGGERKQRVVVVLVVRCISAVTLFSGWMDVEVDVVGRFQGVQRKGTSDVRPQILANFCL